MTAAQRRSRHGENVLARTAMKTIVKETAKDTISDTISGGITEFATEKLELNAAWSTALNIGIGLGLDKGMDLAGQKVGVGKKTSVAEDMSFEDAKRYNQYWDELEKGVHIDYPGMTKADIDVWNLADVKLNEHVAVSKVDTDAVVELRKKEAAAQESGIALKKSIGEGEIDLIDKAYDGVKRASEYLKQSGVPRQYRKQILKSFEVGTIKLEIADANTYGLRFYGGNASAEGRYLFETFSPLINRVNLALPYEWNSMTGIQQFQIKSGTTVITGAAAPQASFGEQYIGGAKQWYINNLEDLIKCQ